MQSFPILTIYNNWLCLSGKILSFTYISPENFFDERTFKMIYKRPLQLFRILLGFRNKSTYFDQKQRAFQFPPSWICIRYAYVLSKTLIVGKS
jgi:hypothetical protein